MQRLIVLGVVTLMGLGFALFLGNFIYDATKKPTDDPSAVAAPTTPAAGTAGQQLDEDRPAVVAPNAATSLMLDVSPAGPRKLVAVGERGRIIHSDSFGASWTQAESVPSRTTLTAVAFANEQSGWAVGHDAVILSTTDGGVKWNRQYRDAALGKPLLDVVALDAGRAVAVGAYGLILSTNDGGNSWQTRSMADVNSDEMHLNAILRLPALGGSGPRLVVAGEQNHVFLSDDDASSWRRIDPPGEGSLFGLFEAGGSIYAVGLKGRMLRSDDRGETWREIKTNTGAVLMGGTGIGKGDQILAVGALGTLVTGAAKADSLTVINREDRMAFSGALGLADGTVVLIGERGPIQVKSMGDLAPSTSSGDK